MKELIKVEVLRSKVPDTHKPSKYAFMALMGTGPHHVKPSAIDKMKAILERDHANNIAWLESRKAKYIHKTVN